MDFEKKQKRSVVLKVVKFLLITMRVHENTAQGGILVQGHCYYSDKGPKDRTETWTNF